MKQVYYSKNKSGLWMINEQEGRLRISGADSLRKEDIEVYNPDPNWCDAFHRIEIAEGVTDIYEGFLENFRNLSCLILPKSVIFIETAEALRELLDQNKAVIHAAYGSFGERFAEQNGLKFYPENILLGWRYNEQYNESSSITLRFYEDGSMDILYDYITSGWAASNNGGGSITKEMPEGYYPGCTIQEFAELFPSVYYEQIIKNLEVKAFLEKQKQTGDPAGTFDNH